MSAIINVSLRVDANYQKKSLFQVKMVKFITTSQFQ
jgi:hypothetical protein